MTAAPPGSMGGQEVAQVEQQENRIAWTEREGPGRPPGGPSRGLSLAVAGVLATVFSAIMFTDTLCPEHRAWVQALAVLALTGTVVAIVGLARQWASAAMWALGSALCGIGIGVLDAAHAPARGRLVAVAFAVVAAGAAALAFQHLRLHRWASRLERGLAVRADAGVLAVNDRVRSEGSGAAQQAGSTTSTR